MPKILQWETEGTDGAILYRLDCQHSAMEFFRMLSETGATDGSEIITIHDISELDWAEIEHWRKDLS